MGVAKRVFPISPLFYLYEDKNGTISFLSPDEVGKKDAKVGIVEMIGWDITYRCNLNCKYCYLGWVKETPKIERLPANVKKKALHTIQQLQPLIVSITGGEPTLVEDLPEIISTLVKEDIAVGIITNGTLPDRLEKVLERENNVSVSLSIDGPKNIHNKLRGGYDKVIQSLEIIKKYGITDLIVNTVITKENSSLKAIEELFNEVIAVYEPNTWRLGLLMVSGNAEPALRVSPSEYFGVVKKAEELVKKHKLRTRVFHIAGELVPKSSPCGRLWYPPTVYLLPTGDTVWCNRFAQVGIKEKYEPGQSSTQSHIRMTLPLFREKCKKCNYALVCAGGCPANAYLETGAHYAPDPSICDYVQYYMKQLNGELTFHDLVLDPQAFAFNPYRFVEEVKKLDRRYVLLQHLRSDPLFIALLAFMWERILADSREIIKMYPKLFLQSSAHIFHKCDKTLGVYGFALSWGIDLAIGDGWGNIVGEYIVRNYGAEALAKDLPETRVLRKIETLQGAFYSTFVQSRQGTQFVEDLIAYLKSQNKSGNLLQLVTEFIKTHNKFGNKPLWQRWQEKSRTCH